MPDVSARMNTSQRLLSALSQYEAVAVIMHDNPDPDAIATGWAVSVLVESCLHMPVRVVGGGAIVRAENRRMVELLQPPIELVDSFDFSEGTATVLVDCGLGASNQLLTRCRVQPAGVIDHHLGSQSSEGVPFVDVRSDVAASASIAASYLREQKLDPGFKLATALLYAIRTETQGYQTVYSSLDRSVLPWLTERGDPELLAAIENAPLQRAYYGDLVLALQNTFLYDDVALCFLPQAQGVEIVGEVADLLIRCDNVERVLCAAVVDGDCLLSARTAAGGGDATKLIQETLVGLGGAGGHAHRAGGKITAAARGDRVPEDLGSELRTRWLTACGVQLKRGRRLVPRHDIVENL